MKSNIENQSFNQRAIEDQEDIAEISKIFNIGEQNQLPKLFHQLVKIYRPTDRNAIKSFAQQINDILDAEQHNTQQKKDIISNILKPSTLNKLLAGKYNKEQTVTRKIIKSKLAKCWVQKAEIKKYLPNLHAKDAVSVDIMIANAQGKKLIVQEEEVDSNELSNVINGINNGIKLLKLLVDYDYQGAAISQNAITIDVLGLLAKPNIDLTIIDDYGDICRPYYLDVLVNLLTKGADIEAQDEHNKTLLDYLRSYDKHNIANIIANAKFLRDLTEVDSEGSVQIDEQQQEVAEQAEVQIDTIDYSLTPLIEALIVGDEDKAKQLIMSGVDLNDTARDYAKALGYDDIAKMIKERLERLYNQKLVDSEGSVQIDAQQQKVGEQAEVQIDTIDYSDTPLIEALIVGNEEKAKLLIMSGENLQRTDKLNTTALYHAELFGYDDIANMIKERLERLDNQKLVDSEGSVQIDAQQPEVGEQAEVHIDTTDHNVNIQGGIDTNDTL
jgi:ankyrin repeat protein